MPRATRTSSSIRATSPSVATALAARLAQVDAANAATYQQRLAAFSTRWSEAMRKWEQQAQPLRGMPVVAHHKNMTYLWSWLGVREVATLQPKPGVEPSGGYLSDAQRPARAAAGEAGRARRLRRSARVAVALGARPHPGRRPAVHGRRQRQGERPVRPLRQHASSCCWRRRNELVRRRRVDPAAGVPRRPAGAGDARAARHPAC